MDAAYKMGARSRNKAWTMNGIIEDGF